MQKQCRTCKNIQTIDNFYFSISKNGKKYPASSCKKCENKRARDYHIKNKESIHIRHREWRLKTRFSISNAEYDRILKEQNFVCAICKTNNEKNKKLAVDHDHLTGNVRGILCTNCNMGLGRFKDNIDYLSDAIRYLKKSE